MAVWPTIARFVAEHGSAALVTLADVRGSSPREAGARMVVRPDGGFTGTIGGGTLEWSALAEAQAMLARGREQPMRKLDKALGPDLGQCCGGRVIVTIERFDARDGDLISHLAEAEQSGSVATVGKVQSGRLVRRVADADDLRSAPKGDYALTADGRVIERFGEPLTPLMLFGAGHVGRSLVLALAPLPFTVTWVDPRPSAFPQHVPGNVTCVSDKEPARFVDQAPEGAFVAVMTHSHALDLDLVAAALKAGRFPYLGLIGSETKRARFVSQLTQAGLLPETIAKLICPIGLTAIRDKAPAAIAASIVAQLLIVRETIANARASGDPSTAAGPQRGAIHA